MTDLRKAAEMALEVMEYNRANGTPNMGAAIEALRQALAQPEQEPVAWGMQRKDGVIIDVICPEEHSREPGDYTIPLYTAPPKHEWVGLTDEDKDELLNLDNWTDIVEAVEAKLKEKNGG